MLLIEQQNSILGPPTTAGHVELSNNFGLLLVLPINEKKPHQLMPVSFGVHDVDYQLWTKSVCDNEGSLFIDNNKLLGLFRL